ncbi:MAG: hypothetical protein WCH46_05280 [bacterium]
MNIHRILFFLALSTILFSGCNKGNDFSGPINSFKRYPYEKFHLSYELTGNARGTEEVYVAGYGKDEAQFSNSEIFGEQGGINAEHHILITHISRVYTVDTDRRNFMTTHMVHLDSLYHLDEKDIPTPIQYMQSEMKTNFLKNVGSDIVDGKPTSKWQMGDGEVTVWMWNGILVKKTAGVGENTIVMTIKNIDTLWAVDTMKFKIPAGYTEGKTHELDAPESN